MNSRKVAKPHRSFASLRLCVRPSADPGQPRGIAGAAFPPRSIQTLCLLALAGAAAGAPDFEREIAPILESACLSCHDAGTAKGDLRLDAGREALAFDRLIVPGEPDRSLLIEMVSGPEPEMPREGAPLSGEQVGRLRGWIAAGAAWPEGRTLAHNPVHDLDWWSLRPIVAQPPEDLPARSHPVDAFIDAKLSEKGLAPAPEADPATLIRRLTYDLTGLPPTPEEVERFLRDRDWAGAVDRLLASPAFGEKFARHWLDLARYAETHGYDKDKPRERAWPYRDYVVRSLNDDKPYARFVREQVAGDALFPGEPDGVVALGFLAAGPWDFISHYEVGEGKLDGRIAKHLDRDEMASAVFNVFLSTTIQCAQCHHHKLDPIRMEDYYRVHAVFAAVDRAEREYEDLPPEQAQRRRGIEARIDALGAEHRELKAKLDRELAEKTSDIDRRIAALREDHRTEGERKPQYGYHSRIADDPDETKWVQVDLGRPRAGGRITLVPAFDNYAGIGAGFGFPVRYRVEVSNDPGFRGEARMWFDATGSDQPNPGERSIDLRGEGSPFRFVRVTATRLAERRDDYIFALAELQVWDGDSNLARGAGVTAKDSIEAAPRWGRANLVDGVFHKSLSDPAALAELEGLEDERAGIAASLRTPESTARLSELSAELQALRTQRGAFPEAKRVYAAATEFDRQGKFKATGGAPRPVHLLRRGDLKAPGERMSPGAPPLWPGAAPAFFAGPEWKEEEARAELARYLTQPDNPLLWRSIANRLWQWTMGAPLVPTPNDFGRGGLPPSHPELLDFLAARLRDDPDQSVKSIVRLLVTSGTYRRSSEHRPANAGIDADNAFLWRGKRRRLTAEEYRDSLLAVSGALDRAMGGPGFQDFVIEKPQHSPHYRYDLHDPGDARSHRRSIYRFVVRSQPQPMLTTLDCADPSMSVPAREESTTALQALTQWNNRFVEAMARRLAQRLREEAGDPAAAKVDLACHLALGRAPTDTERPVLLEHLTRHGEASFARVLFNLNAFVYVD